MKGTFKTEDIPTVMLSVEQKALLLAILARYGELEYTSDNDQYWFFCSKFSVEDFFPVAERKIHIRPDANLKTETREKALRTFLNDILLKERNNGSIYFKEDTIRHLPVLREHIEKFIVLSTITYAFTPIEISDAHALYVHMEFKRRELTKKILERKMT